MTEALKLMFPSVLSVIKSRLLQDGAEKVSIALHRQCGQTVEDVLAKLGRRASVANTYSPHSHA